MAVRFPEADPEWTIAVEGFDPATNRMYEGVFTTGSGYLHVRGSLEEGLSNDPQDLEYHRLPDDVTLERRAGQKMKWGTYIPGIVGPHPLLNEEIINLPWFIGIMPTFDGEPLDIEHAEIRDHCRLLDLRNGVLHRRLRWLTAAGAELELEWQRYISLARRNLGFQELHLRVLRGGGQLTIDTGVDAGVRTSGFNHFTAVGYEQPAPGCLLCTVETNGGNLVTIAVALSIEGASWQVNNPSTLHCALDLTQGDEMNLIKLSAVATDRDPGFAGGPAVRAMASVTEALADGSGKLLDEQDDAWSEHWRSADVRIEGDPMAQLALRYSIYHLIRSHPADPRVAICPKGYSGDAYFGRFFWDTEIYLSPFYIYTDPARAADLVLYRHRTLSGARRNAATLGYRGARYAWESGLDGSEQCPNWQYADLEVHVTADIVYGLCHYAAAVRDRDFMSRYGLEIMIETARYWADRVDRDAGGGYHLLGVMGPDEYTPFARDNSFTNHLVKFALSQTAALLREEEAEHSTDYESLVERLRITPGEIDGWEAIANGLQVPRCPAEELVLQSADFPFLADLDLDRFWTDRGKPLGQTVPRERRYRSKCLKQADVLALMMLFPQDFTAAELEKAYDYYEPLTSHDSSLSPTVHAIIAAWLGRTREALDFFRRSARVDLEPDREGASDGVHIANAGGNWAAVVHGFAGVRNALQSDVLYVEPHLPEEWHRLQFRLFWHGCPVRFALSHAEISVCNLGAIPVPACLAGQEVVLQPGVETAVSMAARLSDETGPSDEDSQNH